MIKVKVPATTANIGSGFDCLGIALNLYNTFYIEEIEKGLIIEGCEEKYCNTDNLIYLSMKKCFEKVGYIEKGIKIKIASDIPESRGLGSSASCILGGVIAANEILKRPFSKDELLNIATEIEGHPDNIVPALFGGIVVSVSNDDKVFYNKINIPNSIMFYALIPDFPLSTQKARGVLPKDINYKDAIFNIGRVATLVSAFASNNLELIKLGCEDKLHQPYRGCLIENYEDIVEECQKHSVGTFLSGAGPTIMNIAKSDDLNFEVRISAFLSNLKNKWCIKELKIDCNGAIVENF